MAKTKLPNEIPNDVNSQKVKLTGSKKQDISKLEKLFLIERPVDENSESHYFKTIFLFITTIQLKISKRLVLNYRKASSYFRNK